MRFAAASCLLMSSALSAACAQPAEPPRASTAEQLSERGQSASTPDAAASDTATPVTPPPRIDHNRAAKPNAEAAFEDWLLDFRAQALASGVDAEVVDRELAGLTLDERAIRLDRRQPDVGPGRALFADYLPRRLTPQRISAGVRMKPQVAPALAEAEREFGVPGDIVLAIWGMETAYGAVTGDFDVIRALASLAFDGRREALFTRELIAALRMIDEGLATRQSMTGSWAGAMGNSQFLPTSYLEHAVDQDGDGRPNIWGSEPDTIGSIANYLNHYGWQRGEPWAIPVTIPEGFDRSRVANPQRPTECVAPLEKHSRWLPVSAWRDMGIKSQDGESWPDGDIEATLLEVDGEGTGAHLTFRNYRALLGYNCSNFYALSVGMLADEIAARTE
ncbi:MULTISPECIES: lytic murein transglycosylase [Pacificimonas]|nr:MULTISPECIES: lytic murein transglycosylase [Pacificimonas]MBZ6378575.1 lytic murein transglycosylase [Pacificimonas aurantium]